MNIGIQEMVELMNMQREAEGKPKLTHNEVEQVKKFVSNRDSIESPICQVNSNPLINAMHSMGVPIKQTNNIVDDEYKKHLYDAMTPEQREQGEKIEAIQYMSNCMNKIGCRR